ncbi:hypothetical protein M0811_06055 [Anaeramoeba ignava]|uniref:Uncharacterized protein n=1 Tax=Anaeramoeba ignava TaxID=1746090 RepID=A0A9Q0LSI0_ANAIG|nr:hypothetical protein M0811_06055 [Anaeramoeba ignava]
MGNFDIFTKFQTKKRKFISILFDKIKEDLIEIFDIFFQNINQNENLTILLNSKDEKMKEIWNNIFQQFEIPCYSIYKTKTIKQKFPFSSIIYSIIQQNETISQQNKNYSIY